MLVFLETTPDFDPRKQGHAYVCFLKLTSSGKIVREFVERSSTIWHDRRKNYFACWHFVAPEGAVIETRLSAHWRKDEREYYIVVDDKLHKINALEAFELAKKLPKERIEVFKKLQELKTNKNNNNERS